MGRVQAGAGGSQVVSTQGFALPVGSIVSVFVFQFSEMARIYGLSWVMCFVMALDSAFI